MVTQWSKLKNLTMRNEAQNKIEAWSPAVGAKGVLQSRWFRVSKIPVDQRSIRTLAKVGGLVGKVIEVDEGTLQKIWACMTNTICHVKSKNYHIKQLMTKITCHASRHITTVT